MASCSIVIRALKNNKSYYINNEILNWLVQYQDKYVDVYNIGIGRYVDEKLVWDMVKDEVGDNEEHPLRYYRLLPLSERRDIAKQSFGDLYDSNKISSFIADTYGVAITNPINPPIVGTSSYIGNLLLENGSYFNNTFNVSFFTLMEGNNTSIKDKTFNDKTRIMEYFKNQNRIINSDQILMQDIQRQMIDEERYWESLSEPYYPYLLYEKTGIDSSQYEVLLELIDAMDVANVGRESSIFHINDSIIGKIKGKILRFSVIDDYTVGVMEAIYRQLNDNQKERFVDIVSKGDNIYVSQLMNTLSISESQLKNAISDIIRGVGYNTKIPIFYDNIYQESIDRDKIFEYSWHVVNIMNDLSFMSEEREIIKTILGDMIMNSPFALIAEEYKASFLLSSLMENDFDADDAINYLSFHLSNEAINEGKEEDNIIIKQQPSQLPLLRKDAETFNVLRYAFEHPFIMDENGILNDMLLYYYMGKYDVKPSSISDIAYGKCQ